MYSYHIILSTYSSNGDRSLNIASVATLNKKTYNKQKEKPIL